MKWAIKFIAREPCTTSLGVLIKYGVHDKNCCFASIVKIFAWTKHLTFFWFYSNLPLDMQIAEVFWTQNAFKEGKLNRCENDEALLLCMSNDANDTLTY